MNKTLGWVAGCVVLAAVSCKKDGDDKETRKELVTSAAWKVDRVGIDNDGNGTIDMEIPEGYALRACELDNTYTFNSDGSGTLDEGATKCEESDPQNKSFEWSLKENDKVLYISGNVPTQLTGDIQILSINTGSFRLSKKLNIDFPIPLETTLIVELKK